MKRFLCLMLSVFLVATVFSSCSADKASDEVLLTTEEQTNQEESSAVVTTEISVETTVEESTKGSTDWRTAYSEYLQGLIDGGVMLVDAWVKDVDGDGIPLVAVSTMTTGFAMPHIIINFKNGKLVEGGIDNEAGSGWSILDRALFVKGTDYIVSSHVGNTTGTLTYNNLVIYEPGENGEYKAIYNYETELPKEYEDELRVLYETYDSDFDFSKFQNYFIDAHDTFIRQKLGDDVEFYNYADVKVNFGDSMSAYGDESAAKVTTTKAIEYFNQELGIELSAKV